MDGDYVMSLEYLFFFSLPSLSPPRPSLLHAALKDFVSSSVTTQVEVHQRQEDSLSNQSSSGDTQKLIAADST